MVKAHSKWIVTLVCVTLTWGTQPQAESPDSSPSSSDRRGGSNAASAMALAASAMQQVMCLKMMQEAQQKGDSTLMMMAMQMCAQAAASAANAAQNKDGGKKLTSTPPQTNSAAPLKDMKLDTQAKDEGFDPNLFKSEDKSSTDTASSKKDEVSFESPQSETGTGKVEQGKTSLADGTVPLSSQTPKELPASQIELSNSGAGGSSASSPWAGQASGLATAQNTIGKNNESGTGAEDSKRKPLKKGSGSIDGTASGNGGAEPGDNSAFDDFVAKMMGGGANSSYAAAGLGAGMIDITMDLQGSGAKPLTIFEFASLQYQKAKQTGLGTGVKRNLANSQSR